MKQILWASPTLVDRFGFTVFGVCDFAAVFGCCSPAKPAKNEPPVVGPFSLLLVPFGYRYTCASFGGSLGYLGRLTLWYLAPPSSSLWVCG